MITEFRKYGYRKYEYGWMVYSTNVEGKDERIDMCYMREADAISHTIAANKREPERYADAIRREEEARKRIIVPDCPYYSITGYYGD